MAFSHNIDYIHCQWCAQEGDLDSAIKKYKGYLPEEDIMLKFVQIALALHDTHSKVSCLFIMHARTVQLSPHWLTSCLRKGYGADAGFVHLAQPYHVTCHGTLSY